MTKFKTAHMSANASAEVLPSGVLVVVFGGPITAGALAVMKRQIVACIPRQVVAVVADYRAAVIALDNEELRLMMGGEDPDNLPGLPAAVVCRLECAYVLKRHAVHAAASAGRFRRVFLDPVRALAWAKQMANEHPSQPQVPARHRC